MGYTKQTENDYGRYNLGSRDNKAVEAYAKHQRMLARAEKRRAEAVRRRRLPRRMRTKARAGGRYTS